MVGRKLKKLDQWLHSTEYGSKDMKTFWMKEESDGNANDFGIRLNCSRLRMACLYIDRLKSNFQRAHHFSQRTNNGEIWCPRSSINRLCNYKCEHTPEASPNVSVSVKFKPAVQKIFTIGLHLDYEDTSNDCLSVIAINQLFKQYLDYIVRRYWKYFRSSSKLVSSEDCNQNMCSFNSLVSIVSKCSKEIAKNIWDASKGSNHSSLHRCKHHRSPNERSHNFQTLSRDITKPNCPDKRTLYVEHRQDKQKLRKNMYRHSSAVNTENEDVRSMFGLRTEHVVDRVVSSDRSNASGNVHSNCSPIPVAKRSVCVQTSRRSKSRSKDRRKKKRESHRKENSVLVSTKIPSSQDVRTIFRTNSEDFNRKDSNSNLDLFKIQRKKTACVAWRTEGKSRSDTLARENGNSSRKRSSKTHHSRTNENDDLRMIYQNCMKQSPSVSTRIQTILTNDFYNNIEMENAMRRPVQFDGNNGISALNTKEEGFLANSIETLCDSASLYETVNASQTSRDFQAEDKSSETIILGNIKKRLEEDYDDYFSFDEFENNSDVFETWPKLTSKINQTPSDSTIDYHVSRNKSEITALKAEALTTYRKPKHSEHNILTKSIMQNRRESSQANMTYSFSVHCTNSNLSHSQSSYYTPSQEQDDSPCSSVEYCSATNNSSSNFSRTSPNLNLLTTVRTYPLNTGGTSICSLETSPLSIRSPDDVSSRSNPMFQKSGERFSETMINSRAMKIRRRRSSFSKHLSNSSKLITESFDSGVLTDYSRDHVLSSSERSQKTRTRINHLERNYCAREPGAMACSTYDFNSDSSYSDDSLNRRLEVAVKQFTEDLVLTERKVRLKLRRLDKPTRSRQRRRRRPRRQQGWCYFEKPPLEVCNIDVLTEPENKMSSPDMSCRQWCS